MCSINLSLGGSLKKQKGGADVPTGHDSFVGKSTASLNWQFLTIPGALQIGVWAFVNWLPINEEHVNKKGMQKLSLV